MRNGSCRYVRAILGSRILLRSKFWYEDCIRDGQIEWLISCVLWSAKLVSLLLSYVWNHQGKGFGRCRTLYQVDIEFYGAEAKAGPRARLKLRASSLLTFVRQSAGKSVQWKLQPQCWVLRNWSQAKAKSRAWLKPGPFSISSSQRHAILKQYCEIQSWNSTQNLTNN